jgi:hypothetical protein
MDLNVVTSLLNQDSLLTQLAIKSNDYICCVLQNSCHHEAHIWYTAINSDPHLIHTTFCPHIWGCKAQKIPESLYVEE